MLRGCLLSLLLFAALVVGYYFWLSTVFLPPTSYWASGLVGFIVLCSIGAIVNAKNAWRDWSLIAASQRGLPPRDGRLVAVCGEIHPVGEPLVAPFSGAPCVICEYDLSRHRRPTSSSSGEGTGSDFAGFLMVPSVIRSKSGDVKLLGFPIIDGFPELGHNSFEAARRAIDYLTTREFDERTGLKMVTVLGVFDDLWADEDGFVEKNIRLGKVSLPDLFPPELEAAIDAQLLAGAEKSTAAAAKGETPPPDDEMEDDELDDEDLDDEALEDKDLDDKDLEDEEDWEDEELATLPPSVPKMSEKRVSIGQQVCAIGRYDAVRGGLVPARGSTTPNRLIRGTAEKVIQRSRSSVSSHLIGGILALVIVHAATYGIMQAYLRSPEMKRHWEEEGTQAVQQADIPRLEKGIQRGMSVDQRNASGETLLMQATDPAVAKWLIEHGADVNARDNNGETPLMHAVLSGSDEIVRQLIDAKADLDARSTDYDRTALMAAVDRGKDNVAAMLRQAGAKDDVITAESGEPLPADGGEPLAIVQAYLDAMRARDPVTMKKLFNPQSTYDFAGVDWELWHNTRPVKIESWTGFIRGDDATVTASGASGRGHFVTWIYQLRREGGQWTIAREREG
jgi:hypothetical protein